MSTANIYISTIAFGNGNLATILEEAERQQFNIEFSSGLAYNKNTEKIFMDTSLKKLPHNYFPAPEEPFVLNLASSNEVIRNKSIEMCMNGLALAKAGGCEFYAAHAGFCIDPQPSQLGRQLDVNIQTDKALHWNIFMQSVKKILAYARANNILFLIENNVIAAFNLSADGDNPLFCCDAADMWKLVKEAGSEHFGILLDTGHLKVSAATLGLDADAEFVSVQNIVKAFHHSDNDGKTDSNQVITTEYWCRNLLKSFGQHPHVIEVKKLSIEEIISQQTLLKNFISA